MTLTKTNSLKDLIKAINYTLQIINIPLPISQVQIFSPLNIKIRTKEIIISMLINKMMNVYLKKSNLKKTHTNSLLTLKVINIKIINIYSNSKNTIVMIETVI